MDSTPDILDASHGESNMGAHHTMPHTHELIVIVWLALGVYNAVEVFLKIVRTFKSYQGIYFWSLTAASVGIVLHALGYFFRTFDITHNLGLEIFLVGPGGMMMITGQSVVLYSRLHLISRNGRPDRWLLIPILFDLLVIQVGATTLYAGSQTSKAHKYLRIYNVWERLQVTFFFIQECVISGMYVYRTWRIMRASAGFRRFDTRNGGADSTRTLLIHLLMVNVFVMALDVTILALEYAGLYHFQTSWKTLVYSVKLKCEFHVLEGLKRFARGGLTGGTIVSPGSGGAQDSELGAGASGGSRKWVGMGSGGFGDVGGPDFSNTRTMTTVEPTGRNGLDGGREMHRLNGVLKTTDDTVSYGDAHNSRKASTRGLTG